MKKLKIMLFVLLALATVVSATGCGKNISPYETNNAENYTVSVKFDANGGVFTTSTSVIVDTYNISELPKNANGMAEIALISPDNSARGNDAFVPVKNGYFLAGWYSGRTESLDNNGNIVYDYSDRWDFESGKLSVDPSKNYTAENPVLTLYAAWAPLFEIEFYSLDSGELLERITVDPSEIDAISLPAWNKDSGMIDMFRFPEKDGFTFANVYYDELGEKVVEGETFAHPGKLNYENGTAENSVLKLYVEWTEGEWYHIYTAKQFMDNLNLNGNYEIMADLDFAGVTWGNGFMFGNFNGVINGNGHSIKNIEAVQSKPEKVYAGLFGTITDKAKISNLTFENVTFVVTGTRVVGASYGLLAGNISKDAVLDNVGIVSSRIQIKTPCYFGVDDYSIGLVCGMGNSDAVANAEIECVATGNAPESIVITVNGNEVIVTDAEE